MSSKPVIERIEDDLRRDIIASFKKWLDRPDTKIEGVERFWEYKIRLLLAEISCLSAENKALVEAIERYTSGIGWTCNKGKQSLCDCPGCTLTEAVRKAKGGE